ncbi:type II toxin-antitoxin system YafQ family toxin [Campylobacter jejuni]|nr:type II toxin-antitoxin system YafQ family toxin [Campylobacter jejuni]EAJ5035417.1 type II toxin-antitoxin system YafQ family toxin [Campylobacter jejuni]EAK4029636.1 type II toxin-antitoxin system YafQ family toxin [Campylobacter jejuni]EAL0245091.1 type II toxin-antitoxin system YafQ family toxin [Campylobacter jejuni]EAM0236927.1 type II toxin-antitoxin system YafQ family toxin [Campylobacter jejuni]
MAKYKIYYHKDFIKAYKKISDEERKITDEVIVKLSNDENLEPKYKDHQLKGVLKDFRECHIFGDLVIIYKRDDKILSLYRIGRHQDLFKKY